MIYCVVPRPLADELYPKLVEYYRDDENVTVIVDRRHADRRAARGRAARWGRMGSGVWCATAAVRVCRRAAGALRAFRLPSGS